MKLLIAVWVCLVVARAESSLTCRYKKGQWSECNTLLMVRTLSTFQSHSYREEMILAQPFFSQPLLRCCVTEF